MKIDSASREKLLENFTRINHKGVGTLILKSGDQNHILITADPEIIDLIRANVAGQYLEITMSDPVELGLRSLFRLKTPDYRIEVTCTNLQEVVQRGVGNVQTSGVLESKKLHLENRGVGDVNIHVHCDELITQLLGVGNITVTGEATSHDAEIKGTGRLEAFELQTAKTHIVSSGVGTSRVYATEELYAELNGVGRIVYRGKPRVESKLNGLGSIVSE